MTLSRTLLTAAGLLLLTSAPALAQDDDDDFDLDDILGTGGGDPADGPKGDSSDGPSEVALERSALSEEPTPAEATVALPPEDSGRRIIKTLQQKNFLKIGRYEASPMVGFVTNDPFIYRRFVGGSFTYHPTEIFALEIQAAFSPDLEAADWRPITQQLVENNRVSPDISKIIWLTSVNTQFSPIYGKLAVVGGQIINFDVYASVGAGVTQTKDDLRALNKENEQSAIVTQVQVHPTMNFGAGFRVIFTDNFAARIEGRSMTYIETVDSTNLEYKSNFILNGAASFFFPKGS